MMHDNISERMTTLFTLAIKQFDELIKAQLKFHGLFCGLIVIEFLSMILLSLVSKPSWVIAINLACLFITTFSYFILYAYTQIKTPLQLSEYKKRFIISCQQIAQELQPQNEAFLAKSLEKLASALSEREYTYLKVPQNLAYLDRLACTLSAWSFWKVIHKIREELLTDSLSHYLRQIRENPTNLKAHTDVADALVRLSQLYADPFKMNPNPYEGLWISPERSSVQMKKKFQKICAFSIEEFKIMCSLANDDPAVWNQLACSYHELQMPEMEIQAFEKVLELTPEDSEVKFKLGILYFQEGFSVKGLKLYEELRKIGFSKHEHMLDHYGQAYTSFVSSQEDSSGFFI